MSVKEQIAIEILKSLHSHGHEAYFAGGCVRDKLRGVEPKDFDIATSAGPKEVQNIFTKTIPVGIQFGVVMVVEQEMAFEVATFRTESNYLDGRHPGTVKFSTLEEDAKRRDFTVNGLYFDIKTQKVIDLVGGQKDLKAKIIRTIGEAENRFGEDHLRMMRVIRFACQLGFEIEDKTLEAVKKYSDLIVRVSPERIRDELTKTLISTQSSRGIKLLDETGLLKHFLPEIEKMKGVEQPCEYHPEGDVFVHTLMLLDGLNNAPIELAMGCLLHDVAKPNTFVRAQDRIRFHGHDVLGAEMSEAICKRLTFSNAQTKLICELVAQHLRFKDASKMKISTLKRFLSMDRFDLHLELHRLDCMASHKKLDAYYFCKEKWEELKALPPPPLKLVTGKDLISFGLKPGPQFSEIIRRVEDNILEGIIKTREEALEFVKSLLSKG
ncbi:MAG: CCA tRNA nucleotidyltransferase [Deltaproteobacteria bacterium]|nr:CCA tRNA nucleotidyltransferase [Deltaproteobacteria bacterium]